MNTREIIQPILYNTYGHSPMCDALGEHLAVCIDRFKGIEREGMILLTCWDFFSGGDTAAGVAKRIEQALTTTSGVGWPE